MPLTKSNLKLLISSFVSITRYPPLVKGFFEISVDFFKIHIRGAQIAADARYSLQIVT